MVPLSLRAGPRDAGRRRYTSGPVWSPLRPTRLGAHAQSKPNILVIWGDDIGTWNISHNNRGMMGHPTPNIDRIAKEGLPFTDYYGQQSCKEQAAPTKK